MAAMTAADDEVAQGGAAMARPLGLGPGAALALCAGAACGFGVSFPPIGLWPAGVLAPGLLAAAAIRARTTRAATLAAFIAFLPAWAGLHVWVLNMTAVGWPFLSLYLSIYAPLFVWIVRRMRRARLTRAIPGTVIVPVVWTGLEFLRGSVFMDGYPWYLLGQPWIDAPVMAQSADLFGVYFMSFLAAMASGAILDLFEWRARTISARRSLSAAIACGVILIANVGYGVFRLSEESRSSVSLDVLIMQTNLKSSKERWEPNDQQRDVVNFAQDTIDAAGMLRAKGETIDLIVWPETMVPGHGFEEQALRFLEENEFFPGRRWLDLLTQTSELAGGPVLVGSPTRLGLGVMTDEDGTQRFTWDASYNSAYLIDAAGPPFQRYDKVFLTPFGETMPYISAWPWLERTLLALGARGMTFDLDAADEMRRITLKQVGGVEVVLATPICFEDTVPSVCRRLVYDGEDDPARKADVMVNLSNDGWFGWSHAGRAMHGLMARIRCIENRVPLLRAANTGISMHVDSTGKVVATAENGRNHGLEECDLLHARVTADERETVYSRIGNLFPAACLALMLAGLAATFVRVSQE